MCFMLNGNHLEITQQSLLVTFVSIMYSIAYKGLRYIELSNCFKAISELFTVTTQPLSTRIESVHTTKGVEPICFNPPLEWG